MEAADPPAGGGGGGGGGAAADGVAPHVAAAAAAPGEQAPAPLAAAAVAVGEHDLAAMDVLEEHDAEQVALAAEELGHAVEEAAGQDEGAVEVPVLPPQPVNEGVHPEAAGQDEGAVEVPVLPPQLVNEGVLPEAAGQDEGAVEVPVLPPQPVNEGVHPQPQQGHVGGDDDDEGDVNQNHQGGLPEAQPQEQQQQQEEVDLVEQEVQQQQEQQQEEEEEEVDLVEQEVLQQEEEIAAFAGQLPLVPFPAPGGDSTQVVQGQLGSGDDDENSNQGQQVNHRADYLGFILAGVTLLILGAVLLVELGTDITTWMSTLQTMTPKRWMLGVFVAMGDISSLVLIYAPAWKFRAIWRREEGAGVGAGLATMLPLIAAFLNGGVWVLYGAVVAGQNWSVIIINGVGMLFQVLYVIVFCGWSEAPWRRKLLVLMLGAGAGVVIAVVDYFLVHLALGVEMDSAIGWSGAATSITMYALGCAVNMSAAARDRGARGVPAQAWVSVANATIWLVCGALAEELRILVPNVVGIVMFLLQASQLIIYRFSKPQQEDERDPELQRSLLETREDQL